MDAFCFQWDFIVLLCGGGIKEFVSMKLSGCCRTNHVSVCFEVYRSEIVLHDNDAVLHLLASLLYQ